MAINAMCGPVWVLNHTGTICDCSGQTLIHSVSWSPENSNVSVMQLEDLYGRVVIFMRGTCDPFRAYTKPLEARGLFLRTMSSGAVYLQVDSSANTNQE